MGVFFYLLGIIIALIGAGWSVLILGQPTPNTGLAIVGKLLTLSPGLGTIGAGLIFIAIGAVLERLGQIVRNGDDMIEALERLADRG